MSVPDKSIDPRLLAAAKEEFLEKGYEAASLQKICKAAGVTTGALYKRYKGKEDLFSALVSDVIKAMNLYNSAIKELDLTKLSDRELYNSIGMPEEAAVQWMRALYEYKDGFTLLIKGAPGTRYQNFHHDWARDMNEMEYKFYREARNRGLTMRDISMEQINVLTHAVLDMFAVPFILGFTWEQMEQNAKVMHDFLDWHKALGIEEPKAEE